MGSLRGCSAARAASPRRRRRDAATCARSKPSLASSVVDLQLVGERARLYGTGPGRAAAEPTEPPYKGLASFGVGDAEWFFGRERLVADLIARLAGATLLGVVGPSGSGKSSAVRAGLIPALSAGRAPGKRAVDHASMRPGRAPAARARPDPLEHLAEIRAGPDRRPGPAPARGPWRARRRGTPRSRRRPVRGGVHGLCRRGASAQRSSPR